MANAFYKKYCVICFHDFDILTIELGQRGSMSKCRKDPTTVCPSQRDERLVRWAMRSSSSGTQKQPDSTHATDQESFPTSPQSPGKPTQQLFLHAALLQSCFPPRLSAGVLQYESKQYVWEKSEEIFLYSFNTNSEILGKGKGRGEWKPCPITAPNY